MGSKLTILDEDALIKILKVVSWLDHGRWNTEDNYNLINFFSEDLTNSEKILTHWISYITDRQMPFEIVWDNGGYVFSEMAYEYLRSNTSPEEIVNKHYEEYYDEKSNRRFRFKSQHNNVTFASRYVTDDYQNILQTLVVLDGFKRNIVAYVTDILRKFKNKDDLLLRVACGLHLLTYQLSNKKSDPENIIRILSDDEKFEGKLAQFKKTSTTGKKRLWCCVRDYKKGLYHEVFNEAIKEVAGGEAEDLIRIWDSLPMDQIELPGDVWNNSPLFRDNLFSKVIDLNAIPKTWEMPTIVRKIYDQLNESGKSDNFYPEQFDITFDFVPRMCSKKLCNVCLFGPNGIDLVCIPTEDKYCPVALVSCGYIAECVGKQNKCPIKNGISKGICKSALK